MTVRAKNMSIEEQREQRRKENFVRTKKEALKKVWEMEENNKLVIEGNKQRVNISIHAGLWKRLDDLGVNKSQFMEKLLKDYLSVHEGKEIILRKSEF